MLTDILLLVMGFVILVLSSRIAIRRLLNISKHFGISEFLVSFFIVGTVAVFPELAIGINSAIKGISSFGFGVVVGSNIVDLTLIMGIFILSSYKIKLHAATVKQSKRFLFAIIMPILLIIDGILSRVDGFILITAFIAYVVISLKSKLNSSAASKKEKFNLLFEFGILAICLYALLFAGSIITDVSETLSIALSIPIFILGTILAIGTCIPELTFAIQSSKSKHSELGVGDILGNVFADCMLTLGIIALIHPIVFEQKLFAISDGIFMIFSMLAVLYVFNRKTILSKKHGLILISLYFVFILLQNLLGKIFI